MGLNSFSTHLIPLIWLRRIPHEERSSRNTFRFERHRRQKCKDVEGEYVETNNILMSLGLVFLCETQSRMFVKPRHTVTYVIVIADLYKCNAGPLRHVHVPVVLTT